MFESVYTKVISMSNRKRRKRLVNNNNTSAATVVHVKPLTKGQENYIRAIAENTVVLCSGPAGTGKSAVGTMLGCQYLVEGKVKKIVIARPIVSASVKTLGALPGGVREKVDPYLIPLFEQMNKFFGPSVVRDYISRGMIEIVPLELMRGRTFDDTFIVVDESQNCTFEQLMMALTRIGKNSKCVLNGDLEQTDLGWKDDINGFLDCIDLLKNTPDISIVKMTDNDIVRSPIVKSIIRALRNRDDLYKEDK